MNLKIDDNYTRKLFCGPAVVAAITGIPAADAVRLCDLIRGHSSEGTSADIVEKAIGAFGWKMRPVTKIDKYTRLRYVGGLRLAVVDDGDHYVLVEDGWLVDSANQTPIEIQKTRFADAEIKSLWAVKPAESRSN